MFIQIRYLMRTDVVGYWALLNMRIQRLKFMNMCFSTPRLKNVCVS